MKFEQSEVDVINILSRVRLAAPDQGHQIVFASNS